MKFCANCANSLPEGATVCPFCGNAVVDKKVASNDLDSSVIEPALKRPRVHYKNIFGCIVLTFVTFFFYGLIWLFNIVDDTNTVAHDEKSSTSSGVVFLLSFVTLGIYWLYWLYKMADRLYIAGKKYRIKINNNKVLYLILGILIIPYPIVMGMIQNDLNKFSK